LAVCPRNTLLTQCPSYLSVIVTEQLDSKQGIWRQFLFPFCHKNRECWHRSNHFYDKMLPEYFSRKLDHIFSQMRSLNVCCSFPLPSNITFNVGFNHIHKILSTQLNKTPWPEFASELNGYLRPYSRFSRPDPLLFLPNISSVVLTRLMDPVPDPVLLIKYGSAGNRTRASGSVARNSDH
jgi:hypothetical protein